MEYRVIDNRDNEDVTFKNGKNYFITPHGDLMYYDSFSGGFCDAPEYLQVIAKAQKPLLVNGQEICPNCMRNERELHLFCDSCGQKIDWNDKVDIIFDELGE